jgi:acetate kinase
MSVNVLVLNCGSSSVKFQLFLMPEEVLIIGGKADKTPGGGTSIVFKTKEREWNLNRKGFSFKFILEKIIEEIVNPGNDLLKSLNDVNVVGHRLIHGGEEDALCVEITEEVISNMKKNVSLAPLHYPPNIAGIQISSKMIPHALQTGVFDTAFHQTMPPKAYLYGIPLEWYQHHKIRRYGFHGTSHMYAAQQACELTGLSFNKSRIITCHLGNGASVAAIRNGKSADTSMGFTPVEGLLMGTRCGDIDAGVLLYLQENFNLTHAAIQDLINRQSGLLGISGLSSDYRQVEEATEKGNPDARLALEMYHYRVRKYIGAYSAVLEGLDLIVFTGGIGENSIAARRETCSGFSFLGLKLSQELNRNSNGKKAIISDNDSDVKVVIVPANEELVIARLVTELAGSGRNQGDL